MPRVVSIFIYNVKVLVKLVGRYTQLFIHIHKKEKALLELIQSYLGGGRIYDQADEIQLRVSSIKELKTIINHFEKYPLISQKWADYILFKQIVNLMVNKEHLTHEGLRKIVAIRALMNLGLSEKLKEAFAPHLILLSWKDIKSKVQ